MKQTKKQWEPTSPIFKATWEAIQRGEIKVPRLKRGFWVDGVLIYPPINQVDKSKKKTK